MTVTNKSAIGNNAFYRSELWSERVKKVLSPTDVYSAFLLQTNVKFCSIKTSQLFAIIVGTNLLLSLFEESHKN